MGKWILLESDNTSTVLYLNKQGGTRLASLNQETPVFYDWMMSRGISYLQSIARE
jgi:hypothetical protein